LENKTNQPQEVDHTELTTTRAETTTGKGLSSSRRALLRNGLVAGGAGVVGASLLGAGIVHPSAAVGRQMGPGPTKGDLAILQFLAVLERIETDLWQQYNELGGIADNEILGVLGGGAADNNYKIALRNLDGDMNQYIHDNTDDEFSHFTFINAYLQSKGVTPVSLDGFKRLSGSNATGSEGIRRITNLMELTVSTSWWTRYRSSTGNPDLGDTFDDAIPTLNVGTHTAIPRDDNDFKDLNHIQAIANTAAFHFGFIEQGGSSLYPSLAQRVSNLEVLRILLSIGPTETMHFQVWHDKAGNALTPPNNVTDGTLVFPNFGNVGEDLQANLIMPEPTFFLNSSLFPKVSIIRPTETKNAAAGAVAALKADGLFNGQGSDFFTLLNELAEAADDAERQF
jgi:hypothetical protein